MTKSKTPKGVYANYFQVGYTAFELVIDFGQNYAAKQPDCHTRIVTSPVYARSLLETLSTALDEYRQSFGDEDNDMRRTTTKHGTDS